MIFCVVLAANDDKGSATDAAPICLINFLLELIYFFATETLRH